MKAIIALDKKTSLWSILCIFLLTGCQSLGLLEPTATPNPPTATTVPPTELTICLGVEPESLYPYSATSQAAQDVLQAIYDGPIDMHGGEAVPVILERIPSITDGSVSIASVEVSAGNEVIDTRGYPITLRAGVEVFPAGCTRRACTLVWDGSAPLMMDQMAADYTLLEGMRWSDGQPLRAADSVFSFRLASDPATPLNKLYVDQTESYSALDVRTVHWVGKPGLLTDAMERYFWMPLPEHAWGEYTASELLETPEANRAPLGWGAYVLEEWVAGESIRLKKNPNYFRAAEGLPYFDSLIFRITNPKGDTNLANLKFDREPFEIYHLDIGDLDAEILSSGCDLTTTTADMRDQFGALNILLNYYQDPAIKVFHGTDAEDELVFFNLRKTNDGKINPLLDVHVREVIYACIDKQKIVNAIAYNLVEIPPGITFSYSDSLWEKIHSEYDPDFAKETLDRLGWVKANPGKETKRTSSGIPGIPDGMELNFLYLVETEAQKIAIAQMVKDSLIECSIALNIHAVAPSKFWNPGSEDSIFQGQYDMAQFTWISPILNPCVLFNSSQIPKADNAYLGINFSGFSDSRMDELCDQIHSQSSSEGNARVLREMEGIINANIPVFPLFRYNALMLARKDFCEFDVFPGSASELSQIENLHFGENSD